jgi:hypothetical protein
MMNPEIFKSMTDSRHSLLLLIEKLSEEDLTRHPVEGVWTIKDLLAHLSSWERVTLEPMVTFAREGVYTPAPIHDENRWNALQSQSWQGKTLSQTLDNLISSRQELIQQVSNLPEDLLHIPVQAPWGGQETIIQILEGLAWHEEEHTKSIENWLMERS